MWHVRHLRGEEGQRSLDQQTHQPLRVEDELIATRFLVSKHGRWEKNGILKKALSWTQLQPSPLCLYLMMVCMPLTWGVLSRTLRVWGRGCAWCAEARAALSPRQQAKQQRWFEATGGEDGKKHTELRATSFFLHVGGHTCEHIPQKHTQSENMQKQKSQMRFPQRLRAPDTGWMAEILGRGGTQNWKAQNRQCWGLF